jgi:vancomycin resistance protein YoaR
MDKKGFYKFFVLLVFLWGLPLSFAAAKDMDGSMVSVASELPNTISISVKNTKYTATKDEIKKWLEESTSLDYNPQYFSEIENSDFCSYKKSLACALSFGTTKKIHIQKKSAVRINEDSVSSYVATLALKANKNPEDARLKVEDGKVSSFSTGAKGLSLDEEKSTEMLTDYIAGADFTKSLNLPYTESDPKISNIDSISELGVSELIGEGRSNFRGSPKNRIFNINVATKRFNGVLIKPGEDFSFVGVLGEVDGDHGYLPELVIKKDKTEPEFGGGICQVSTTAYRAALNSGLKITARRNHAYPVQYYNPQGMDATVYVPRPDLRFTNNTPKYILIQTTISGTELIFDFYGTSDGRKVEIIGPKIVERNPDGSMKTTLTQKVTDASGKVIIDDDLNSSYDSPSKYPHPGTTSDVLTQKPNGWSDKEWSTYKKQHGL